MIRRYSGGLFQHHRSKPAVPGTSALSLLHLNKGLQPAPPVGPFSATTGHSVGLSAHFEVGYRPLTTICQFEPP